MANGECQKNAEWRTPNAECEIAMFFTGHSALRSRISLGIRQSAFGILISRHSAFSFPFPE
jgi:hypothetical protein